MQEGVGNPKVRKWIASVDDNALRLSVATLFEKRRGVEMLPNPNTLGLRDAWSALNGGRLWSMLACHMNI